jgi:hypothetical protein
VYDTLYQVLLVSPKVRSFNGSKTNDEPNAVILYVYGPEAAPAVPLARAQGAFWRVSVAKPHSKNKHCFWDAVSAKRVSIFECIIIWQERLVTGARRALRFQLLERVNPS